MPKTKRFKRERKLYHLNFETEDLAGFECYVTGCSLAQFIEITALGEVLKSEDGQTEENVKKQFTMFSRFLQSWNLDDDDDKPVPCDYDGLAAQDFDFVQAIMVAWMQAIATVPEALEKDSRSGEISPEASLGLARLSQSLPS